jgi:bacterioferritin
MAKKAIEIIEGDVKEIVGLMNRALADEWLAYYQYWVGAKVVRGRMRPNVQAELEEHAEEELKHANMLAERIIQLGGTPLLSPDAWNEETNCGYDAPKDEGTIAILKQNIKGEQCAIGVYHALFQKVKEAGDAISLNMVRKIMEEEVEHEQDLQDLLDDLNAK